MKRALVIGINYAPAASTGTSKPKAGELQCAHRDARIWRDLLLGESRVSAMPVDLS